MSEILRYKIAGREATSFSVPVTSNGTDVKTAGSAQIPEWMVKIDDLTGKIKTPKYLGYEEYCELFGWYAESSCDTKNGVVIPTANLKHSEVIIIIPVLSFLINLELKMNQQKPVAAMEVIRTAGKVKAQTILFENCTIKNIQQELDRVIIKMDIARKTDTITVFEGGQPAGQVVSFVDYLTGEVK